MLAVKFCAASDTSLVLQECPTVLSATLQLVAHQQQCWTSLQSNVLAVKTAMLEVVLCQFIWNLQGCISVNYLTVCSK